MYHPLDELLEEVNKVAQAPTIDELRDSVTNNVVAVYRKIAAPSLWEGHVFHFPVEGHPLLTPPRDCMRPLDMAAGDLELIHFSPEGRFLGHPGDSIRFAQQGKYLRLLGFQYPHLRDQLTRTAAAADYTGPATLSYWGLPEENGEIVIDDRIWTACRHYCRASEALDNTVKNPRMPTWLTIYQLEEQKANRAIDEARAEINAMSPNRYNQFWDKLSRNLPG